MFERLCPDLWWAAKPETTPPPLSRLSSFLNLYWHRKWRHSRVKLQRAVKNRNAVMEGRPSAQELFIWICLWWHHHSGWAHVDVAAPSTAACFTEKSATGCMKICRWRVDSAWYMFKLYCMCIDHCGFYRSDWLTGAGFIPADKLPW